MRSDLYISELDIMLNQHQQSRRNFIKTTGFAFTASVIASEKTVNSIATTLSSTPLLDPPQLAQGIRVGDVLSDRAIVWSRANCSAKMIVKYSFYPDFKDSILIQGPLALKENDYTTHIDITGLPAGRDIFIQVMFQDLNNKQSISKASSGHFRTAPNDARPVRFLWSGDSCGQGWGINPDIGGMKIYETMRLTDPDFFIHCGDSIYADCPIHETQIAHETGQVWRNLVTEEVSKVAETLEEYRGRYKYNLMDHNLRKFNAQVPTVWLWDDHEITNNWSPSKNLDDDKRYTEKNITTLVKRGTTAALEYAPIRYNKTTAGKSIYRNLPYGPLLELFVLDMRSYRGPNNHNRQEKSGVDTAYLGHDQLNWLKTGLKKSTALWKVIAADMPIGLSLKDGVDKQNRTQFENLANGDGSALGRELEIAELLAFAKQEEISNMVWFTADVHYCAAHYYDPDKAQFKNFDPFWEFISGPLNASSFGPQQFDNTFGPQLIFQKASPNSHLSPLSGLQFFGQVDIDNQTLNMTVTLKDIKGDSLFTQIINPTINKI